MRNKLTVFVAVFALLFTAGTVLAQNVLNYSEQGGARWVVGGSLDIASGGEIDVESGAALKIAGTAISATGTEINNAADISAAFEVVAATNVLTTAECGKTMTLAHATEFASTLPAPTAGCRFKFIVGLAPASASYTILSASGDDIIHISVNELETDTGDDGPWDDNADTVTFVDSVSDAGDWLECISDGTSWFCTGQVQNDGALTTSTT